jgi:site-specific DNA-methyltransferase (adenine-specific)/modification methylase
VNYTLYNADCLSLLGDLPEIDAVVTDPPYGSQNRCDYTRFTRTTNSDFRRAKQKTWPPVAGDDQPFDPAPWLEYKRVALWGYQHFAHKLRPGTVLVWDKKRDSQLGHFTSDAELCWLNRGKGVWTYRQVWYGLDREGERGQSLHPTQKSVGVMRWVMQRLRLKPGMTVLDPYMGSGSTGVACAELGCNYIGVEVVPEYFNTARQRIEAAYTRGEEQHAL